MSIQSVSSRSVTPPSDSMPRKLMSRPGWLGLCLERLRCRRNRQRGRRRSPAGCPEPPAGESWCRCRARSIRPRHYCWQPPSPRSAKIAVASVATSVGARASASVRGDFIEGSPESKGSTNASQRGPRNNLEIGQLREGVVSKSSNKHATECEAKNASRRVKKRRDSKQSKASFISARI